ncbi:MAG: beta-ketoacyl synthase N-terminal-like domain-containing protein [Bacteroidales bacterium]|nr:beta-ketoacyl synthase N-terminal-like domain-containing protein [Bacteroidales bacterium]
METDRVRERVYVVADSIYSPLGFSTKENMKRVSESISAIKRVDNPDIYSVPFNGAKVSEDAHIINELSLSFTTLERRILFAIEDAAFGCGASLDTLVKEKTRLLYATTKANISLIKDGVADLPPELFPGESAERINRYLGLKSAPLVLSNACISGVNALITAARLIEHSHYDNVIVVGADEMTRFVVSGFEAFHSISPTICRPYDASRDGLSLGEAVGVVILSHKREYSTEIDPIVIEGGAVTNDANHLSAPSRTGDGLGTAMLKALESGHLSASQIDFINAHGTSTSYNDEMESKAIHLASLSSAPVQSLKPYWGHTLGASGVVESIASFWQIRDSRLLGTMGYQEQGVSMELKVTSKDVPMELNRCMKSASGFGGCNAAIVFARESAVIKSAASKSGVGREPQNEWQELSRFVLKGEGDFDDVIRARYKELGMKDIKFFKMDNLSKAGVIATASLLRDYDMEESRNPFDYGFFIANSSSSLDTDIRHQNEILIKGDTNVSPAIFVYTLPNILMGESAIRFKFQGENTFFVTTQQRRGEIMDELMILAGESTLKVAVIGWCEFFDGRYDIDLKLCKRD